MVNHEEIITLRKSFDSVKQRQQNNYDLEDRKEKLKEARKLCVGNEELLEEALEKLRNNGIKVYLAKEKHDAIQAILNEVGEEKLVVKSKSNVTKEIELTKTLEEKGITVVETDIGDRILQIMNAYPSHPTGPVAHLSVKRIASVLATYYKRQIREEAEDIVNVVREDILFHLKHARIGITGANAITIEEGAILLAHNEGNIYEVMKKDKHIVITTIDKLYPNIESAINMIKIVSFNATGSLIPSFIEVISGLSKTADVEKKFVKGIHQPYEIILILLDNKRSELAKHEFKELLYCVGCGNCLLYCPMYNVIGNEYAENNYLGGRGLAYNSVYSNMKNPKLELCLRCGKCKQYCPLEIDIPNIIRKIRSKTTSSELHYFLKSHMIWMYYLLRLKIMSSLLRKR